MSLISNKVVPGKEGQVFGTDAKLSKDLEKIRQKILTVSGVNDVTINEHVFPREFKVCTDRLVELKAIEDVVIPLGFHVVPKEAFDL